VDVYHQQIAHAQQNVQKTERRIRKLTNARDAARQKVEKIREDTKPGAATAPADTQAKTPNRGRAQENDETVDDFDSDMQKYIAPYRPPFLETHLVGLATQLTQLRRTRQHWIDHVSALSEELQIVQKQEAAFSSEDSVPDTE